MTRAPRDHFVQKIFLAAEVIVGQRQVHAGALGDGAQRDAVEPAFGEAPLGRVQDREPRRVAAARDRRARRAPATCVFATCAFLASALAACALLHCARGLCAIALLALSLRSMRASGGLRVRAVAYRTA